VITIQARYETILERISRSAQSVGRDPNGVRLVVVTKLQPVEVIREVISAGARFLGENYADEAVSKMNTLHLQPLDSHPVRLPETVAGANPIGESSVQWHIIGHVQSRKARLIGERFHYLHSLDSVKLAQKLDQVCKERERVLPVLLEMNVSGEQSKFGMPAWDELRWNELLPDVISITTFPSLRIKGLMTIAPFFENPEDSRPYFQRLRRLQEYLSNQIPQTEWQELSMGMSGDFDVAIQEGATWVRIGQAILGPRPD
jgi:pyridoxal phosphate enzyme (YggS family)